MRIENLKASVLNVSEYRAALAALKASQPTKAELAAVVEELTGIKGRLQRHDPGPLSRDRAPRRKRTPPCSEG